MGDAGKIDAGSSWKQVWNNICDSIQQFLGWNVSPREGTASVSSVMDSTSIVENTRLPRSHGSTRLAKIDTIIVNLETEKTLRPNSVLGRNAEEWINELKDIKSTLERDTLSETEKTEVGQKLARISSAIVSPDISQSSNAVNSLLGKANGCVGNGAQVLSSEHKAEFSQEIDNILQGFQGYGLQHNPLHRGLSGLKRLMDQGNMTYREFHTAMLDLTQITSADTVASLGTTPGITR
jgi:hypothetical protein